MSMPAGSDASKRGSVALISSITSIVFEPGWRMIATLIAGSPRYQLPSRTLEMLSITFATSPTRTGAPLRYAMIWRRNAAAFCSCPSVWMIAASSTPFSAPVAWFAFGSLHGLRELVDADAARRERGRIGLDPHRVFRGAEHVDLRDAVQRRQLAREQRLGIAVDHASSAASSTTATGTGSAARPGSPS